MKQCTKCNRHLPLDQFYKKASGNQGRTARCIECTKQATTAYKKRFPEETRQRNRKYNYAKHNLTIEQWDQMLLAQNNGCAVCGDINTTERNLHIDHDHSCCPGTYSCGKCVRGLLCSRCNTALGLAGESVDRLMQMAAYLLSHTNVLSKSL